MPVALTALLATLWVTALASPVARAQNEPPPPSAEEQLIEPAIERRDVVLPRIDTEDFEAGVFVGLYSVEDFGADAVYGMHLDYHIIEDIFVELTAGATTVKDSTFRDIGLPVFDDEKETLYYYNLSLGYNILPGELFFGRKRAWTTAVYVIGGVGNTHLDEDERFTINFGLGWRVLMTDWAALRIDMRDHVFDSDILGDNKTTHNLEWRTGLSIFF